MEEHHSKLMQKKGIECRDFFLIAGEYHDGELPILLQRKVNAHLLSCAACKQFSAEYELLMSAVENLRNAEYQQTEDDRSRLRAALEARLF